MIHLLLSSSPSLSPEVYLLTFDQLPLLFNRMQQRPIPIGLDLETTGLNPLSEKVVTVQFGTVHTVFILDCRPFYTLSLTEREQWCHILQQLFERCPLIIGHNLKFDWKFLAVHFGIRLERLADTMLQEQIIRGVGLGGTEGLGIAVNLQATAQRYGISVRKEERSWFIGLDKRTAWFQPFPQEQLTYIVQDIAVPLTLYAAQQDELAARGLQHIADLEHACLPAIASMELAGCAVDVKRWRSILARKTAERETLAQELQAVFTPLIHQHRQCVYTEAQQALQAWELAQEEELTRLREEFDQSISWASWKQQQLRLWKQTHPRPKTYKLDPSPVNLGSSTQMKVVLEATLGQTLASTDKEHLQPYARQHPLIEKLLLWKKLDKFITAFGETVLKRIDESDGRIHPEYKQIGAATGRMSCSAPNWQQLPAHEPEETSIRRCVITAPGNVLLTADFSNIELRILAEMSQDTNMLRFFAEGKDLHSATARMMFGLPEDSDPKKLELKPGLTYRDVAKVINFGLDYGMSVAGLAAALRIDQEKASTLIDAYFATYRGAERWLKQVAQQARQQGFSQTIAGRKRFYAVPPEKPPYDAEEYASWQDYKQELREYYIQAGRCERQAKNAPIQGTSADILKYALALLYRHLPPEGKIIAAVHDEIILETPETRAGQCAELLSKAMYKACRVYLKTVEIPLPVVSSASYWKKE